MDSHRVCGVCGQPIPPPRPNQRRSYCSAICRNRAFRMRQSELGRKRTRHGYRDGLAAWDAEDRYGATA